MTPAEQARGAYNFARAIRSNGAADPESLRQRTIMIEHAREMERRREEQDRIRQSEMLRSLEEQEKRLRREQAAREARHAESIRLELPRPVEKVDKAKEVDRFWSEVHESMYGARVPSTAQKIPDMEMKLDGRR